MVSLRVSKGCIDVSREWKSRNLEKSPWEILVNPMESLKISVEFVEGFFGFSKSRKALNDNPRNPRNLQKLA